MTGKPAQTQSDPDEIAPSCIFFAGNRLSAFCTGQNILTAVCETIDALDAGPHVTKPKSVRWWRHVSGIRGSISS
jgi:hypothetical protein